MKISECIANIQHLYPNEFNGEDYIKWLYELDLTIQNEIINTHEGEKSNISADDYSFTKQKDTTLLVPEPYCTVYEYYLQAQVDYHTGETNRYQNSMAMFNSAYQSFANYYNRTHLPLSNKLKFFD